MKKVIIAVVISAQILGPLNAQANIGKALAALSAIGKATSAIEKSNNAIKSSELNNQTFQPKEIIIKPRIIDFKRNDTLYQINNPHDIFAK